MTNSAPGGHTCAVQATLWTRRMSIIDLQQDLVVSPLLPTFDAFALKEYE